MAGREGRDGWTKCKRQSCSPLPHSAAREAKGREVQGAGGKESRDQDRIERERGREGAAARQSASREARQRCVWGGAEGCARRGRERVRGRVGGAERVREDTQAVREQSTRETNAKKQTKTRKKSKTKTPKKRKTNAKQTNTRQQTRKTATNFDLFEALGRDAGGSITRGVDAVLHPEDLPPISPPPLPSFVPAPFPATNGNVSLSAHTRDNKKSRLVSTFCSREVGYWI